MSYLCFKSRMMEEICFGWINNCQKKRASLLPRGYMCWKNQHQSYTGISSMTVIQRVPFEGFIIKKHCSSMRYVNIEGVINITWIWIHIGRESSTEIKCSQACRLQTLNHVDILQFFFLQKVLCGYRWKSHISKKASYSLHKFTFWNVRNSFIFGYKIQCTENWAWKPCDSIALYTLHFNVLKNKRHLKSNTTLTSLRKKYIKSSYKMIFNVIIMNAHDEHRVSIHRQ